MSRFDPTIGRRRERVIGGIVVAVGIAVLVLSIVALAVAGKGPGSDVAGPTVTLPKGSVSSTPTTTSSGTPTSSSPTSSASTSTSPPTSATATNSGAVGSQPLVVLNNTSQSGLAQQAAATFTQGGWTVTSTGNLSQDTLSTCAYYDPNVPGAQAAAEALMAQFPAIKRVKEKYGALPAGPVVVVLTTDYTAQ